MGASERREEIAAKLLGLAADLNAVGMKDAPEPHALREAAALLRERTETDERLRRLEALANQIERELADGRGTNVNNLMAIGILLNLRALLRGEQ